MFGCRPICARHSARRTLEVRPQPKKDDMAEVFINDEFVATLYREVEDGETSYQFQMAILDMDLEGV